MADFVTEAQQRRFPTEIEDLLEARGFREVDVDGTKERVFGKRVDSKNEPPMTLRVYTTVDTRTGNLREKGSDAIRVALFAMGASNQVLWQEPKMVGAEKSVYRVQNWKENLRSRLDNAKKTLIGPRCSNGHLMTLRNGSNGKFWGCSEYPRCTDTKDYDG